MRREIRHYTQENPKLVLEMLFYGPSDAKSFDLELCKNILLKHKAIYSASFLEQFTPQTHEIGVGIDLSLATPRELVDTFAEIIQNAKGLLFFYAPYYSAGPGTVGEFRWDRTKGGYQILHKATILENPEPDTPEPMHLITLASAALSDPNLHATTYNIIPTSDPNEVLIAPY